MLPPPPHAVLSSVAVAKEAPSSQRLCRGFTRFRRNPSPTKATGSARAYRGCSGNLLLGERKLAEAPGTPIVSVEVDELAPTVMLAGDKEHVGGGVGPLTWQESWIVDENTFAAANVSISVTCWPALAVSVVEAGIIKKAGVAFTSTAMLLSWGERAIKSGAWSPFKSAATTISGWGPAASVTGP